MDGNSRESAPREPPSDRPHAFAALRKLHPSTELLKRIERALDEVDQAEGEGGKRRDLLQLFTMVTLIVLPTLALVVQLSREQGPFVMQHVAEQRLRFPASGDLLVDLSSSLEAPSEVYSKVALRIPKTVTLRGASGLHHDLSEPRCDESHCVHELHDLRRAVRNLSLAVPKPGRYAIGIERSEGARRRKDLVVVHANP